MNYKCPDGKIVDSVTDYISAWYAIIKPFEENFNVICTGFNPTLTFVLKNEDGVINWNSSVQFPLSFVTRINDVTSHLLKSKK